MTASLNRFFAGLSVLLLGLLLSTTAFAECGGSTQCIAVGLTVADARTAHHGGAGPPTPTMVFAAQQAATTSASQTVFVAAVTGPVGTMAALGAITLSGPNAAEFQITGGTCSPANGPVHDAAAGGGTLCTITVAFRPTSAGEKTALLNVPLAPPCGGCIPGRSVNLRGTGTPSIVGPTASPATLSVPVNTPTALDLLPFTVGGATDVSVPTVGVGAPANGTVTVAGTTVTYTPKRDYFGPDTFSYSASNIAGASALATVTVTVTGRPDPAQDLVVRGVLRAQADTARRFAQAQISNLQRRMESLHPGSSGSSSSAASGRPGIASSGAGHVAQADPFALSGGLAQLLPAVGGLQAVARDPHAPPDGTIGFGRPSERSVAAGLALMPPSFVTTLAGAVGSGTLNLSAVGRADGFADHGTGLWMGGSVGFGTRDASGTGNASRFASNGITLGIDHRFSSQLALGASVGFARDRTTIGTDGSTSAASGHSFALYGSYQPARHWYVDGLLGYGVIDYDSVRFVPAAGGFARADRRGNQWFGALAAGYEHRQEGLLLSPYGRIDFGTGQLRQATETGVGLFALTYDAQRLQTLNLALGLRAESTHRTNFGWAMPRVRVEYRHNVGNDATAVIGYADQPAGPRFAVAGVSSARSALLVGLGTDFILRDGLKLGIDYQMLRASGGDRGQGLRLWVSKDFDSKGLPNLAEFSLPGEPVRLEAGLSWDDNLNRARFAFEKISDRIYSVTASKRAILPLGAQSRFLITGFVSGDKAFTYSGLDRVAGGAQGELQYRTSAQFDAFTFGLTARAAYEEFSSGIRSGTRYSIGANVRQSLTDRIDLFAAITRNLRDARSAAFDTNDTSARFNLDYAIGQYGSLYMGGEYRRGDQVTSAPPSLNFAAFAKVSAPDDAYGAPGIQAYRFDARTTLWNVGYNYALGPRDSIDISWRQAISTPTQFVTNPLYPTSGLSYRANQISLAYLLRF